MGEILSKTYLMFVVLRYRKYIISSCPQYKICAMGWGGCGAMQAEVSLGTFCLKNRTGIVYALARTEKEGWQEGSVVKLRDLHSISRT